MMTAPNNSSQQAEFELYRLLNTFFSKAEAAMGFMAADATAVRNASRNLGIKQRLLAGLLKNHICLTQSQPHFAGCYKHMSCNCKVV